ncbi:unnamed protein product [Spirodela intermedia]|uniref:MSP domain-containing protein n=1 Tax=Spirodela intermedia TaxID=51605 RepID=A0A7I8IZ92_SPIIN|nr:unnamed protein product [Spirodela intermedia]CAA6663296.1 unnamed protein product [Spirodela intermedia]
MPSPLPPPSPPPPRPPLLGIKPGRLSFSADDSRGRSVAIHPVELKKQISCSLQLSNKTDEHVCFKVKTTNPKKYCVRRTPGSCGLVRHATSSVLSLSLSPLTMQAQKDAPADMQCRDKFLVQSVVAGSVTTVKDITSEMFTKESGNHAEEFKLRVVLVPPPKPPSPVREGSEESSPRASLSENGALSSSEKAASLALISKLTDEKNSVIQLNNKLSQELEFLRRESGRKRGRGFSPVFVALMAVVGSSWAIS